jgi:hypothetical protein
MLSGLSDIVADCYRRAAECREQADRSAKEKDRAFYLERQESWLKLAQSYQLSERLSLKIDELDNRRGVVTETRACPTCKQLTPIHYRTMFVCTNCQMVFEAE